MAMSGTSGRRCGGGSGCAVRRAACSRSRERRLERVAWRDLVALRWWERLWELTLSLPWLIGSMVCYQRGWLKNMISYSMFYHLEHHLYPAVPTCHLAKRAERVDEAAPEVRGMQVY